MTLSWWICFFFIFNVDAAFLKSSFSSFGIRSLSCNTSFFLSSLICDPKLPLLERKGLIFFQKNLLLVTKDKLALLRNSFLSFLHSLLQKFLLFLISFKSFSRFVFVVTFFKVGPCHNCFSQRFRDRRWMMRMFVQDVKKYLIKLIARSYSISWKNSL